MKTSLLIVALLMSPAFCEEPPSIDPEGEKSSREAAMKAMDVAQGKVERIDLKAIAMIRRFGHEIRFDDLYLSLAFGFSGEEGNERQLRYSFLKFGFILLKDAIIFDDFRYYPLAADSVVGIFDHGRIVTIGGVAKPPTELPDELKASLIEERDIWTGPDGLKVEVLGGLGLGGSGHPFGPGRWIGIIGVMPVRIWDGEVYVGRKHLGKVKDLATNNLIRVDAATATVIKDE